MCFKKEAHVFRLRRKGGVRPLKNVASCNYRRDPPVGEKHSDRNEASAKREIGVGGWARIIPSRISGTLVLLDDRGGLIKTSLGPKEQLPHPSAKLRGSGKTPAIRVGPPYIQKGVRVGGPTRIASPNWPKGRLT